MELQDGSGQDWMGGYTRWPEAYLVTLNSMFARLGTDYEIRNQWFFAILEAMTTD